MSMEGFLKVIDDELDALEKDLPKTKVPKNRDKLLSRIAALRVTKTSYLQTQQKQ